MMWNRNSPPGGGGVEPFGKGSELDATFAEVVDGFDDVPYGPAKSVEFPHHEHVAVVVAQVVQAFVELGAGSLGAGLVVGEDLDRPGLAKCVFLEFRVLLEGRYSCLSDDAHSLGPSGRDPGWDMVWPVVMLWPVSGVQYGCCQLDSHSGSSRCSATAAGVGSC